MGAINLVDATLHFSVACTQFIHALTTIAELAANHLVRHLFDTAFESLHRRCRCGLYRCGHLRRLRRGTFGRLGHRRWLSCRRLLRSSLLCGGRRGFSGSLRHRCGCFGRTSLHCSRSCTLGSSTGLSRFGFFSLHLVCSALSRGRCLITFSGLGSRLRCVYSLRGANGCFCHGLFGRRSIVAIEINSKPHQKEHNGHCNPPLSLTRRGLWILL